MPKAKPQTPEQCEAAIARTLARKPTNPKTAAYISTLIDPKPTPRRNFVMIHEPRHYGQFVEDAPVCSPENAKAAKKLAAYEDGMKRVRSVLRRYPLTPAVAVEFEPVEPHILPKNRRVIRRDKPVAPIVAPHYRMSPWNCRPEGRRHGEPGKAYPPKAPRNIHDLETQRVQLMHAQNGICPCGEPILDEKPSLDHVIPRSLKGPDRLGNLLVMHGPCNGRKSNDIPTGCELVWLLAVNARLGVEPVRW